MYLKSLSLVNFKNYADFESGFSEGINVLTGPNGVGKTNLLDAIHYLSFCKSRFNPADSQNIRHDEGFFVITGIFSHDGEETEIYCGMKRGQKKVFRKNKRDYDRLSEHIGQFPLVMITPGDSDLIHGQSEARRRFLDGIISQYNRQYLERLIGYAQALRQRNTLLRQFAEGHTFDQESLQIWDDQLMLHGEVILKLRQEFIKGFTPIFARHYKAVSGSAESAGLNYESSIGDREFSTALLTALARDRAVMHSTVGPHRDDLEFTLDGHNLRRFGSQGQQKSYLLALKLAEFEYIRDKKGMKPLLLLDDVYDKLDEHRFGRLLELVAGEGFGQVFITDAHEQRIRQALYEKEISCRFYSIGQAK